MNFIAKAVAGKDYEIARRAARRRRLATRGELITKVIASPRSTR